MLLRVGYCGITRVNAPVKPLHYERRTASLLLFLSRVLVEGRTVSEDVRHRDYRRLIGGQNNCIAPQRLPSFIIGHRNVSDRTSMQWILVLSEHSCDPYNGTCRLGGKVGMSIQFRALCILSRVWTCARARP